jgi:hypothetical protein
VVDLQQGRPTPLMRVEVIFDTFGIGGGLRRLARGSSLSAGSRDRGLAMFSELK